MSNRIRAAIACALVACGFGLVLRYESSLYVITGAASSCTVSETFDCNAVQTSAYGKILGVSVSLLAVAGSATLVALLLLTRRFGGRMLQLAALLAATNAIVALIFLGITIFALGTDCLYCNVIQLMSVACGILVVAEARSANGTGAWAQPLRAAGVTGAILLLLAVQGEVFASGHERLGMLVEETGGASRRVDIADALLIGDPERGAQNSFLVYFDFGCPRCRACYKQATTLQKKHPDRVHFFFKHWPLDRKCNKTLHSTEHPGSCAAARAAQAAQVENRTAEAMNKLFFAPDFSPPGLRDLGPKLGIDAQIWQALLKSPAIEQTVERDVAEGNSLDFNGVPKRFRNGRLVADLRLRAK